MQLRTSTDIIESLLSLSKSESKSENVFADEDFVPVFLNAEQKSLKQPRKILVLDIDDTLIDRKATEESKQIVFLYPEKLKQKIQYAQKHNIMLAVATSRSYHPDRLNHYLSSQNILKALGIENFSMLFYTNGKPKVTVLDFLWGTYFGCDESKRNRICMVDDLDCYLEPCAAKYPVIKVEKDSDKHLDLMQCFYEDQPLPQLKFDKKETETFYDVELDEEDEVTAQLMLSPYAYW